MNKRTPSAQAYFRAFYQGGKLLFTAALLTSALMVLMHLMASWMLGEIIDIIALEDLDRLWNLLKLTAVFCAVFFGVQLCSARTRSAFIRQALTGYKSLAFSRLSQKRISAFSQESTGRYLSILTNDVNTLEENYLNHFFDLVFHGVMFISTLIMMFWFSPALTIAAILLCLLPLATALLMGQPLAALEKTVSDQNEGFVARVKDLLNGFSVLKSFKAEAEAQKLFAAASLSAEDAKRNRRWYEGLLTSVVSGFSFIMQFGVFFIGAYLAIRGDITAGTVMIFLNLCNGLLSPIQTVPKYWASRKAAAGLVEKLAQVTEENAGRTGEPIPPVLSDSICLEHVTFGYEPDQPVLKDLSLRLEPGKKYALVGGSGSGKSTLLNLLMGAYDGYHGSIAIDSRELREVDPDSLYDLTSLIGQDVFLFDDTIRNNITMFRNFPDSLVSEAVKRSGLSGLLSQRGENYRCGENGADLSGGERQRVSIARCLLRETPVLLLDEATAALDNQTAFAVTDAILHLDGLTRLVVTHRLEAALMEQYDEIVVLRDGRVREQGTFSQLMEQKGYFYSLFTLAG